LADEGGDRAAKKTASGGRPAPDPGAVDRGNGRGGCGVERRAVSSNRDRTGRPSRRGPGDPVRHQCVGARHRPTAAGAGPQSLARPAGCDHRGFVIDRKSVAR
jgi:hypothetical protein